MDSIIPIVDRYCSLPYLRQIYLSPEITGKEEYVVSFPEIPGCIGYAKTYAEAYVLSEGLLRGYICALLQMGKPVPVPPLEPGSR